MAFDLDTALETALALGASDLHVKVPAVPRVRVGGRLRELEGFEPVSLADADHVKSSVLLSPHKREHFEQTGSADLSYFTTHGRFRVAAFTQRGSASFVFRAIPAAPATETLGMPPTVLSWADEVRGLVVITGPTGCGKSTTGAALIDRVNQTRPLHILTIEDPIEYLHPDAKAIVTQREIGLDVPDLPRGPARGPAPGPRRDPDRRGARRGDGDDRPPRGGDRPPRDLHDAHDQRLGDRAALHRPLRRAGRPAWRARCWPPPSWGSSRSAWSRPPAGGLVLNAEVLVNSSRVRDLISNGKSQKEIDLAVAEGDYYGMRTFDQCLLAHVHSGMVTRTDAVAFATNPHDFQLMLEADPVPAPKSNGRPASDGAPA